MCYGEGMTTTHRYNDCSSFAPGDEVHVYDLDDRQVTCSACRESLGVGSLENTPERQALALVLEYGYRLAQLDEWELDDNFDTTEALYALYCEITGHRA
jgi:hypothetical protein